MRLDLLVEGLTDLVSLERADLAEAKTLGGAHVMGLGLTGGDQGAEGGLVEGHDVRGTASEGEGFRDPTQTLDVGRTVASMAALQAHGGETAVTAFPNSDGRDGNPTSFRERPDGEEFRFVSVHAFARRSAGYHVQENTYTAIWESASIPHRFLTPRDETP
jgi:hypothetical protein